MAAGALADRSARHRHRGCRSRAPHAAVDARRPRRGGPRVRHRPGGLSLPVNHRDARPCVLHAVRGLDLEARVAADPAAGRGVRRGAGDHFRQCRVLPGRPRDRAAVHGRAADGALARLLGRRRPRWRCSWDPCSGPPPCSCSAAWPPGSSGPRWAPAAALTLGVSLPEQFTSRATYSEPLAQVLFLGGLRSGSTRSDRPGRADAGPWRTNWRAQRRRARASRDDRARCSASRCWCGWTGRTTSCS